MRATTSPSRAASRRRAATSTSTRSPAWCPYVSLTCLKWSMSISTRARSRPSRVASSTSRRRASWKVRWLSRPVSGSSAARCSALARLLRARACRRAFAIASAARPPSVRAADSSWADIRRGSRKLRNSVPSRAGRPSWVTVRWSSRTPTIAPDPRRSASFGGMRSWRWTSSTTSRASSCSISSRQIGSRAAARPTDPSRNARSRGSSAVVWTETIEVSAPSCTKQLARSLPRERWAARATAPRVASMSSCPSRIAATVSSTIRSVTSPGGTGAGVGAW